MASAAPQQSTAVQSGAGPASATGIGAGCAGALSAKHTRMATCSPCSSLSSTILRVRDGAASAQFYARYFGMMLVNVEKAADGETRHYLATIPDGQNSPIPTTAEAAAYVQEAPRTMLVLLQLGAGAPAKYHNGNSDPRGYGHIGFIVDDVTGFCAKLEADGVAFQKRPQGAYNCNATCRSLAVAQVVHRCSL